MLPSYSVPVTRREPCSHVTSPPCRSLVFPCALLDGLRNTLVWPVSASQRKIRLFGMLLHITDRASPNQTGPSAQRQPFHSRQRNAVGGKARVEGFNRRPVVEMAEQGCPSPARPAKRLAQADAGASPPSL